MKIDLDNEKQIRKIIFFGCLGLGIALGYCLREIYEGLLQIF